MWPRHDELNLSRVIAACNQARKGLDMDIFNKTGGTPFAFNFHKGDVTHTFVLGSTSKATGINPFEDFASAPEVCLCIIQNAALYDLGFDSFDLARSVGLSVAATQVPNIKVLVDAWKQEPTLKEFADAVAKSMLPQ